jgi:DNA polymerase I-like protein with 3'-5' exonuclease and polymerase domains
MNKQYRIVLEDVNFKTLLQELADASVVAYDCETTGLNPRKDKVIGVSFTTKQNTGWYIPILTWDKESQSLVSFEDGRSWTVEALNICKAKKLVMHNGAFDIKFAHYDLGVNLLSALHADTMLMIHTLQEEGPFALKDFSQQNKLHLGFDEEDVANQEQLDLEENVKANGGKWLKSDKQMYKADLYILAKYAIADTDLTFRLFNFLNYRLEQEGLQEFFYEEEVMPLYKLVTIRMESKGVYLDMQKLVDNFNDITEDIKALQNSIANELLSTFHGMNFVHRRLREEFSPSNKGAFAQEVCKFFNLPLPRLASGKYQITKKTVENCLVSVKDQTRERACAFLLDPQLQLTDEEVVEIQKRLLKEKEDAEHFININSKQHLGTIVFEFIGIPPLTKTDKGAGQFNEDFVEYLADKYNFNWAKKLRVYNKLVKIKSSTFERLLTSQENGVFYPQFKQHATTSGRFGSDLQQLPRPLEDGADDPLIVKYTNVIRELVIPKPGYVFIDDDYESLEPRVFADDAGDQALIKIFTDNLDMYSVVAIMAEGISDASADKNAPNFLKKIYPDKRQNAKAYALGIRYGMKSGKLASSLNIEEDEAQVIIDNYFKAFPNLKNKMDSYLLEAKKTGKVTSKFGRVRHLPTVKLIYSRYGDEILDYKNLGTLAKRHYVKYDDLKLLRKEYNGLLNNALNFPIQSAATSIVNRAAIAMTKRFVAEKLDAWVSLQIHDQLVISAREDQRSRVAEIVQDCMENTNLLSMPLIAKPQFAYNLKDGH